MSYLEKTHLVIKETLTENNLVMDRKVVIILMTTMYLQPGLKAPGVFIK